MDRLLAIYLNDHLAGSTLGVELARRSLRNNRGTEFELFLERLLREITEDRAALQRLIEARGFRKSRIKPVLALVAERAGRVKLNGQATGYSPLSRVVELEGLALGVTGKRSMWRVLRELGAGDVLDLDDLERRADEQLAGLEAQRLKAARLAFADVPAAK